MDWCFLFMDKCCIEVGMREKSEHNLLNCECLVSSVRRVGERFSWGPGVKDVFSLHYVVRGRGRITVDGNSFDVKEGNSFLIFPYSHVYAEPDPYDPWIYKWIEFKGLEISWIVSKTGFTKKTPVVGGLPIEDMEKRFDIIEGKNEEIYEKCRSNARLFELLSYYIQYFPRENKVSNNYAIIAREYIEKNYYNTNCTVKSVSEYVKLDRTYLFRLFKEETGMSVQDYINRCRVAKASTMLMDSRFSVKDIAFSVGFSDQLYFSKLFKKYRGVSPSIYRKEKQSGAKIAEGVECKDI